MNGFVAISKSIIDSEIWIMQPLYLRIWLYFLAKANFKDVKKYGKTIQRGQFFTSIKDIQNAVKYKSGYRFEIPSKWQVWRACGWMRGRNMIATTNEARGILVTICNYDKYNTVANGGRNAGACTTATAPQRHRNSKGEQDEQVLKKHCQKMQEFDEARKIYPGTKRGNETEFENFTKKHKAWESLLPLLRPAIEKQIAYRRSVPQGTFVPQWKNFQTWVNNRCWEEEINSEQTDLFKPKPLKMFNAKDYE